VGLCAGVFSEWLVLELPWFMAGWAWRFEEVGLWDEDGIDGVATDRCCSWAFVVVRIALCIQYLIVFD